MNSTDTPVIVTTVILSSPSDWDEWIEVIKSIAMVGKVWKYVDPYTKREDLPSDGDEKETFRILQEEYKEDRDLYENQQLAINLLRIQIQSSVSRTSLIHTFNCDTTYDMLVSLKQRFNSRYRPTSM
ncbi:hypothetical protein AOQ84DRAFT_390115 [Glonium stellatum]|uniref:Uncharacterized protein n=1 Tax=Glonium stellatum TaxID=574774 RepID=A0A8E2EX99_9PEZI|nr:hypothetical protein AOQ84DRAFT_390115 [Glonium stellatum]